MKRRCLITGASGLIGSAVAKILDPDHDLILSARSASNLPPLSRMKEHHIKEGNLADAGFFSDLPSPVDHVIHLAQSEEYRQFPEKAEEVFTVNVMATLRLLDYSYRTGVKSVILASSGLVYGSEQNLALENQSLMVSPQELGFYYTTKISLEALAQNYAPYLTITVLRFFFVYGPGQRQTMLMPRLMHSVQEGKPIHLVGDDGLIFNPIYVGDAAQAIRSALPLQGYQAINIAGRELLSLRAVGQEIGHILQKRPVFAQAPGETKRMVASIEKMEQLCGPPQTSFAEGIRAHIQAMTGS